MKLKYYLRGLGVGIICTAIIMGIALSGNKKETLTDAEIIERARILGMIMEEEVSEDSEQKTDSSNSEQKKETDQAQTKGSEDQKVQKENSDKDTSKDPASEEKNSKESEEKESDTEKEEEKDNSASGKKPVSGEKQEMIKLEIKKGEYSDVISQKLFQAGLIPDAEKFNLYLTQKGVDDTLRVGTYQIPAGSTVDEIIKILQGNPE